MSRRQTVQLGLAVALVACGRAHLPPPEQPIVSTALHAIPSRPPAADESHEFKAPTVLDQSLPNGMRLLAGALPDSRYVELRLVARHRGDEHIAHLVELESLRFVSADMELRSAITPRSVEFSLRCEPEALPEALGLLATLAGEMPAPDALDATVNRHAFQHDLEQMDIAEVVMTRLRRRMLGRAEAHEHSRPTAAGLTALHARLLAPNNVGLIVAGPVDLTTLPGLVQTAFGRLSSSNAHAASPAECGSAFERDAIVFTARALSLSVIGFGLKVPNAERVRAAELEVLALMLGNSLASLLNAELRERLGLTYGVLTQLEWRECHGMLSGWFVTPPEMTLAAVNALRAKLAQSLEYAYPSDFELARVRASWRLELPPVDAKKIAGSAEQLTRRQATTLEVCGLQRAICTWL